MTQVKTVQEIKMMTGSEYHAYAETVLKPAFNRVCDPIDWRKPIEATIEESELELIKQAVSFYTATEVHILKRGKGNTLVIAAKGYRAGLGQFMRVKRFS